MQERDDIVALDSAIILHPKVWEASGHVGGFTDPLVDCRICKQRFRADHLDDAQCGQRPSKQPGETSRLRPHRGAPVQPHVRDARRPGRGDGRRGVPAAGDGAGHLHQLQERAAARAPEAAVRHRPDRQVVPQRDHARQLHLPHARVRADGDGVLRPARPRRTEWYALLDRRARALVPRPRHPREPPARAPARRRRALALLVAARATSSTSSRSAGRSSRASRTAATSTSRSTPSTPATKLEWVDSQTQERYIAARDRAGRGRRPRRCSRSSSTPTTRRSWPSASAPCCASTRASPRSRPRSCR